MKESEEIQHKLEQLKLVEQTIFIDPFYLQNQMLTQDQAEAREQLVSQINYKVLIGMVEHIDQFTGMAEVSFNLKSLPSSSNLWLDACFKQISYLEINGIKITSPEVYKAHRISLEKLQLGDNVVKVEYLADYVHNAQGLHHFIDPTDGLDYIYSSFAPFFAHRMFPCFDQPSLKATLELSVIGPDEWKYVANQSIQKQLILTQQEARNDLLIPRSISNFTYLPISPTRKLSYFQQTEKLSTYLFVLIAGQYAEWENNLPGAEKFPPMRAYCRQTLAQFFEPNEHFHAVMVGIQFYSQFFDYPFPFRKYDQIAVPEFNYGAMENVGAVTFTENYVYRGQASQVSRAKRNNSIIHELCHMWFGNLVTMGWWNDIWLNESFATYFSFLAQKSKSEVLFNPEISSTKPHDQWLSLIHYKKMGYDSDSITSTHPIAMQVDDTLAAENIFDGISYGKGCAFLKQLFHYISEDVFKTALRSYFKNYEFGNTTLEDFIGQIEKAMPDKPQFKEWCYQWLKTKGITQLSYELEESDGKIAKFSVFQNLKKNATEGQFRDQVLDFALFYTDSETKVVPRIHVKATNESQQIQELIGLKTPSAVLMNSNDWGYTLQKFKDEEFSFYLQRMKDIKNAVDRRVIWLHLFYNARDLELNPYLLFKLALKQLEFQDESAIVVDIFQWLGNLIKYIPYEKCFQLCHQIWTLIQSNLLPKWFSLKNNELTNLLIENLQKFTYSEEDIFKAVGWIINQSSILDNPDLTLKISRNQKSRFLSRIYASQFVTIEIKQELLEKVLGSDPSSECQNIRTQNYAALPDFQNKMKVWNEWILDHDDSKSYYKFAFALLGFSQWSQSQLLKPFVQEFFDKLLEIFEKKDRRVAYSFFNQANPLKYSQDKEIEEHFRNIKKKVEQKELSELIDDSIEEAQLIQRAINLNK